MPYENYGDSEEETFKMISKLTLHNMGWGYTCFVSSFAIFISEKEIKLHKSKIVSFFNDINTEEAFNKLKLPIKSETECADESTGVKSKAFEIDISNLR